MVFLAVFQKGKEKKIRVAAPKRRPPSREQVQIEVDAIMRDVEEKRPKRSKQQQQQLHDNMLSAIFKSVFEDTVPDSAVGIYSSGEKDRMGCSIPKVIDFRSLPVPVQDNLMRAEILPTMWPRYRISGHERMFHYCLMTVTRRQMLQEASCHSLSEAAIENMYPSVRDQEHRDWINSMMSTPDGPSNAVDQLVYSAFECAVSILRAAGSAVVYIGGINAYQLDLFLLKDMGIGGILSKFISRMNDPDVGGYVNHNLPELRSFLLTQSMISKTTRFFQALDKKTQKKKAFPKGLSPGKFLTSEITRLKKRS